MARTKRIIFVVGARPNIIKVDPLIRAANTQGFDWQLVHTGQHYDYEMSQGLFDALGTPKPHRHIGVFGGNRAERVGEMLWKFGAYCRAVRPDLVVVVGDVDSTVACAMSANISGIRVAHVEAGCRSGEPSPEEQNRMIADIVSDYLYCRNNEDAGRVGGITVGDPAIDTLRRVLITMPDECTPKLKGHILLTLHRPENVDARSRLGEIMTVIKQLSIHRRVIFPVHPRTYRNLVPDMLMHRGSRANIIVTPPLDYLRMIRLIRGAALVITDSGGIQLDTSYLGVPCVTVRKATEHKDTVKHGMNFLAYTAQEILDRARYFFGPKALFWRYDNPLWDGRASVRIINHIRRVI